MLKKTLLASSMLYLTCVCAQADTINVAYKIDSGPTTLYAGNTGVVNGPWIFSTWEGNRGFELDAFSTSPSHMDVYIWGSNITLPYVTGLAGIQMLIRDIPQGWSVTETVFYDSMNRVFQGVPLDTDTFTAPNGPIGDVSMYALPGGPVPLGQAYSVGVHFDITATGNYGFSHELISNVNIGQMNPVPGPEVGVGLPGVLTLLLGGLLWWRRSTKSSGHLLPT